MSSPVPATRWKEQPAVRPGLQRGTLGGPWERTRLRLLLDVAAMIAAMWGATFASDASFTVWTAVFAAVAVSTMAIRGGYSRNLEHSMSVLLLRHVLLSTLIALMVTTTARSLIEGTTTDLRDLLGTYAVGTVALAAVRIVREMRDREAFRTGTRADRALVLGEGTMAAMATRRLVERPDLGITPVGYVLEELPGTGDGVGRARARAEAAGHPPPELPLLGTYSDLQSLIAAHQIDAVFVAFMGTERSDARLSVAVASALEQQVKVFAVPRLFDVVNARTVRHRLGTLPIDELRAVDPRSRSFRAKYLMDQVIGSAAIVFLAPLLATLALLVRCSSPGPVLYRQRRVGLDGQEFDILKFRSMRIETDDAVTWTPTAGAAPGGVEGVDRRTSIGRFLRRTNLDELPQLLNIARGDMCIVGPRPERPEFVRTFSDELRTYDARHRVKAGLTGWAQVNGYRGQTSIADRADWDNYYIENWSFALDLAIIIGTLKTFFQDNE